MVLLLGVAFVVTPAERSFPYFAYFAPTSMLQSSVPLADSEAVVLSFTWLSSNIERGAVLMVIHPMYGWSRLFFHGNNTVMTFQPGVTLTEALGLVIQSGYSSVYTVWWENNQGWYGDPTVPSGFALVHVEGDFGVYEYNR